MVKRKLREQVLNERKVEGKMENERTLKSNIKDSTKA
jgi:hypothetical protein